MRKRSVKVFLVRRRVVAVLAALALAAGIFYAVSYPGSVSAAAAKRQLPIYSVERTDGKFCSISFDAAWGNEDTQILIDILARYDIKATFFVVGDWAEKYPESVKALHDAGHEVMSHSNHHDHYNTLTAEQIIADVTASNERISASTGVTPTLIRCPYGEYDDHVISAIRSMGMEPIQWDVEALAAVGRRKSMKKRAVLMKDIKPSGSFHTTHIMRDQAKRHSTVVVLCLSDK